MGLPVSLALSTILCYITVTSSQQQQQNFNPDHQFDPFTQFENAQFNFQSYPNEQVNFQPNLQPQERSSASPVPQNQNPNQLDSPDLPFRLRTQLQKQQEPIKPQSPQPQQEVDIYDFAAYKPTGEPLATLPPLHIPSPLPPGLATATPPTFTTTRSTPFRNLFQQNNSQQQRVGPITGFFDGLAKFLSGFSRGFSGRN